MEPAVGKLKVNLPIQTNISKTFVNGVKQENKNGLTPVTNPEKPT